MEAAEIGAMETGATRGRGGRPAAGRQHEVTARLLAAATRLFLKNGYDGTTCDQVAVDARAGKASIYTRYANKEALFVAVIDNVLAAPAVADAPIDIPASAPQRMAAAGRRVLADALAPDAVALLRLLLAEQTRFAGAGMTSTPLLADDILADASDCRTAYKAGKLTLLGVNDDGSVSFGDDNGEYANDGECDDPRFVGAGMTTTALLADDILHDATDCKTAFDAGKLQLR